MKNQENRIREYIGNVFNITDRESKKDKPMPTGGLRLFGFLLYNHFWTFVYLNFLWLLFSLLVVSIPAATVSMNRVCMKLVQTGNVFVFHEFFKEFKRSFGKSLGYCLTIIIIPVVVVLLIRMLVPYTMLWYYTLIALFFIVYAQLSIGYIVLAIFEDRVGVYVKNSLIIMLSNLKSAGLIAILTGIAIAGLIFFLPYSIPAILLGVPAIMSMGNCVIMKPVLEKYLYPEKIESTNNTN